MSPDCEPRFKQPPKIKPRRRSLKRVGKKAERDIDEMREARLALMERSLGRCEAGFSLMCTGVGVHAHHVKRKGQGGTNDLANLLWTCAICHDLIHAEPQSARERGFLAPKGDA